MTILPKIRRYLKHLRRKAFPVRLMHFFETEGREIALTFDDGPMEPFTSQILNILRREQVHATFFVIGAYAKRHPKLMRRIVSDGHTIGNHTYSHPDTTDISKNQIVSEITATNAIIRSVTGVRTVLFRPPYLRYNTKTLDIAHSLGLQVVLCTVDALNWESRHPAIYIPRIIKEISPGGILLLHDGKEKIPIRQHDHKDTVAALPSLIRALKAHNYSFVTLPAPLTLH